MAKYANVIVDISIEKLDRPFTYEIPEKLEGIVEIGKQVNIPFGKGNRLIKGFVVGIETNPKLMAGITVKQVHSIAKEEGVTSHLIELAAFIKEQYGGTLNQALKTVLPMKKAGKAKEIKYVELLLSSQRAKELLPIFQKKRAVAKVRLLEALMQDSVIEFSMITKKLNVSSTVIRSFEKEGYVAINTERSYRSPIKISEGNFYRPELTKEQAYVVNSVYDSYRLENRRPCLIQGVTGSGKTEVYMELISKVIEEGKQVILLIPEIALTYQTVMRFYHRFGDRVSVLHSRLSDGERYDQLCRARDGEVDIMIGPRSALFTPFENLGLIIIDEEHESSYKSDTVPRYHAREVAAKRATMCNAMLILGSATPSLESFKLAKDGSYGFYKLMNRFNGRALPNVHVVDLRAELEKGNRSMFSDELIEKMTERLQKQEQIMLFLNRRGMVGFISCRSCGKVVKCPHCDVSLTQHRDGKMRCHYCGYEIPAVKNCPACGSKYIGGFKVGTQKVEEGIKKIFPNARVLRMDADTTKNKDGHEQILSAFANKEADILVGTQMIVKGHDFPYVTLVGILAADMSLNTDDYRAAERTFQLLTQAAGRAGRGELTGEVVIQTYNPEHYAIEAAKEQDYDAFFEEEITYRKVLKYPPWGNLLLIMIQSEREENANRLAQRIAEIVNANTRPLVDKVTMMGPTNAKVKKIQDVYRKAIYVKALEYQKLVEIKNLIESYREESGYQDGTISFDFNPINSF